MFGFEAAFNAIDKVPEYHECLICRLWGGGEGGLQQVSKHNNGF